MTVRQVLIIFITLATLSLGEAWWLSHARAADCASYDAVVEAMLARGINPYLIPDDKLQKTVQDVERATGDDYGTVTRGFMFEDPEELVIGFEAGGCLLDPIKLAKPQGENV